jgi:hypothetical protein
LTKLCDRHRQEETALHRVMTGFNRSAQLGKEKGNGLEKSYSTLEHCVNYIVSKNGSQYIILFWKCTA